MPVLQKANDAYKLWHGYYGKFPRLSKYSLGGKIDALFTDFLELLLLAGYATKENKMPFITRASTKLDLLKFFTQTAWELRCLDNKQYAALSILLAEIGRNIGGWLKPPDKQNPRQTGEGML